MSETSPSPFEWDFPYASRRMPVLARNAVAASQPLAAQAGIDALRRGGNAVDAALAMAITLTVVEPNMNGLGSDAFAIVSDGSEVHGLNASGRSPAAWTPGRFAGLSEMPILGWDAVTVPGAVSGWVALSERWGRLPFGDLFEAAIRYAKDGFLVSPVVARGWAIAPERFRGFPAFQEAFCPGGRAPRAGERFICPGQARSLELIAETKGEAFYRGELAQAIAACAKGGGGAMTRQDLENHSPEWVNPISVPYREIEVHEIPPNGQGLAALLALGILDLFDVGDFRADTADFYHIQIEAMKLAFADASRYIADPDHLHVDPVDLLDVDYLRQRAALIDMNRAGEPGHGVPNGGNTVYLAAADDSGMMVSYIQSNYQGFGSGIVVSGTGIAMQNRGWGFTLEPGHPNQVAGGKRPFHTIIPGFVTKSGKPLISFGVMGGSFQAQGHVQMMVRLADFSQNPQAAMDAPRWRIDSGRRVLVETGFPAKTLDELVSRGHIIEYRPFTHFGGAQMIHRLENGYCAASDPRKDGQAAGY